MQWWMITDFSWWVSCFVIPLLRQLVFAVKVWLLAKWYGARNITIWLASSYAPMTHTHKRNVKLLLRPISVIFHQLAQTWRYRSTNSPTHTHANTQLAQMDHRSANPKGPSGPWRQIYAHMEGPSCGSGDHASRKRLRTFPQLDDDLPASDNKPLTNTSQDSPVRSAQGR